MNVKNNQWRLFWSGKQLETLLVLNIISIGSFCIIAGFLEPENMIRWFTITELWLLCAYMIHRLTQQPDRKV